MTIIKMSEMNESIIRTIDLTIELADNTMLRHRPDLFDQWDFAKNDALGLDVYSVSRGSNRKAYWKCDKGHKWRAVISTRVGGVNRKSCGCPYCAGRKVDSTNSLMTLNPKLASEWHSLKNGDLTANDVTCGSLKNAWWKGTCGHEWSARISARHIGNGCPYCAGKMIDEANCLATTHPKLLLTWNYKKNTITPYQVGKGSHKKVWWTCEKEDCQSEYECTIGNRVFGKACSYCHGRRVNHTNSLASLRPDLLIDWDYNKNEVAPDEVTLNSHNKMWWNCKNCGHSYLCSLANKNKGKDCPYCSNQKILVGFNDMWTTNPDLAKLLKNVEDGYKYTESSDLKLEWNCSKCSKKAGRKTVNKIRERGVKCKECVDSMSTGERLLNNLLVSLNVNFVSEKSFVWSEKRRYDFFLPESNTIVEVHGLQHYSGAGFSYLGGRTVKEEQENDVNKELMAKNNRVKNYIVIDARDSNYNFIASSIISSDLISCIGQEEEIDWEHLISISKNRTILNNMERGVI